MTSLSNYMEKLTEKIEARFKKETASCFATECGSTEVYQVTYPLANRTAVEKEFYCLEHLPDKK